MPHSQTYQAIILKTYDVGEADRFCILLTRERGRLAARAKGVRKLTSRMGGSLLPLYQTEVSLHEGKAGLLITSVAANKTIAFNRDIEAFFQAQKGIELLLTLLHDEEESPEIFDLTANFLNLCRTPNPNPTLSFTLHLLYLLGILPTPDNLPDLSEEERIFFETSTSAAWDNTPALSTKAHDRLSGLCARIVEDH